MRQVGRERTPVLVIDSLTQNCDAFINYACHEARFTLDETSGYPGVRAPLPQDYATAVLGALYPLLQQIYTVPPDHKMWPVNAVFSLVCTPEAQLRVLQSLPHFDSARRYYFAMTHYLNPGDFGGTALYRHRPTGFENVTQDRLDTYVQAGDQYLTEHGDPRPGYFGDSDGHYRRIDQVDWMPNRLVAYPGSLLHSGLVQPSRDLSDDPRTGRLTANLFVCFQPESAELH